MAQLLPLSDGNDIPQCFSSAFRCATTELTKEEVNRFFRAGVRHFEIAELFGNGHIIVATLAELCTREDLYITYKIWPKARTAEDMVATVHGQLKDMGLSYVDMLMVHAPVDVENSAMQYKALEDLRDAEVTKSLGVVNMTSVLLQDLLKNCRIAPTVYEMEATPFNQRAEMVEYCGDSSIVVMNLEPMGKGIKNGHQGLKRLAADLGISVTLLMLRWSFTKGLCIGLPANNKLVQDVFEGVDTGVIGIESIYVRLGEDVMKKAETFECALQSVWIPVEAPADEDQ